MSDLDGASGRDHGAGLWGKMSRVFNLFVKWGEGVLAAMTVVCYVLLVAGVIDNWDVFRGLAVATVAGLVVLLMNTRHAVDRLDKRIQQLIESQSWDLLPLRDCQEDLARQLSKYKPSQRVVIRHVGLDMTHAWVKVESLLKRCRHLEKVELQFLVLTDKTERIGPDIPEDVRRWCRRVPDSLTQMLETFAELGKELADKPHSVQVRVRQYAEIPVVHGFAITRPHEIRYFSFCRWKDQQWQKIDWGEDRYRRVQGDPVDPFFRDIVEVFDGAFGHLWSAPSTEEIYSRTLGKAS